MPKFALKRFAIDDRGHQTNLYLNNSSKFVRGASVRDQCYKHKFYDKDSIFEDLLMEMEGLIANLYLKIEGGGSLSVPDRQLLAIAVMLQKSRTPVYSTIFSSMKELMAKMILNGRVDSGLLEATRLKFPGTASESVAIALQNWPMILDLKIFIIHNETNFPFIYSDNPVIS